MYTEIKELGKGSFGVVKLVKNSSDSYFAQKEIGDIIDILIGIRETDALYNIQGSHPSIINIEEYKLSVSEDRYVIKQYLEYCSGGSLEELLETEFKNPDRGISRTIGGIRQRLSNLTRIIESLVCIQNRGVYHMDIKTENVLYRKNGKETEMCLCDFSNYYLKTSWKTGMQAPIIPLEAVIYRPPEIGFMQNSWESIEKADVWAMGVVMLETMGSWEFIQAMDAKAGAKCDLVKSLIDKIKVVQTNYTKRYGKRKEFKTPFQVMFGDLFSNLYPGCELGKKMQIDESSPEYELMLTAFYTKELTNSVNLSQNAKEISKRYFRLRKEESIPDYDLLEGLFENILPKIFTADPSNRISMTELYTLLCELLGFEAKIPTPVTEQSLTVGLWERIPDPVWKTVVEEFVENTKDLQIMYGKKTDQPLPVNMIVFAKHLAEDALEQIIMGCSDEDKLVPKDKNQRKEFYSKILGVCVFISSELMDFIFPFEDCGWYESWCLSDLSPFLKLVGELLMGKIGSSVPTQEELLVIKGEKQLF